MLFQIASMIQTHGKESTLQVTSLASTSIGSRVETVTSEYTLVVWIQPVDSRTELRYQERKIRVTHKAYLVPIAAVPKSGDRLLQEGTKYVIRGVHDASAGKGLLTRLDLESLP